MRASRFTVLGIVLLIAGLSATAGEKMSDTAIKQKLLGYWQSPRHGYHIAADGIMYMCPRAYCTTTNRWDVRGGMFYQDGDAFRIVALTDSKFVYSNRLGTFTLLRGSKDDVDPE
jgi:hypothetical protein